MVRGDATVTDVRVGVIGVGWAGQQHLAAYEALDGAQVVALAGLEETVRSAFAAQYGIERHVDRWEDLLELDGLDAVSVAVPTAAAILLLIREVIHPRLEDA